MDSPNLSPVYDAFLDYLVQKATPREILAFQLPESARERAEELLDRNNAGTLTPEERAELEQMLQTDRLISVLKARALDALSRA
jgi:hypothetical protein